MDRLTDRDGQHRPDVADFASVPVVGVHAAVLVEASREVDAVVAIDRRVGDAVVAGTPIARTWSASVTPLSEEDASVLQEQLREAMGMGFERTSEHDVAFGLRQVADVAVKALSPGINDPTTAVHALNHAAALLCDLVMRDMGAEGVSDEIGDVRVAVRQWSFAEMLDIAIAQPLIGPGWPGTRTGHRRGAPGLTARRSGPAR